MKLTKRQRMKTVLATGYVLLWYFSDGFDWGIYFGPNEDGMIAWLVLFIPLIALFFKEIRLWIASGGD